MKISLSWLKDHLELNKEDIDVTHLVNELCLKTAEVDHVEHIKTDFSAFFIGRVLAVTGQVLVECPELQTKFSLTLRKDVLPQLYYLVKKEGESFRWATLMDMGSEKDGLMTSIWVSDQALLGGWRKEAGAEDCILTFSNAGLTNRPDLWGHRGFAREVSAILGKQLVAEDTLLKEIKIVKNEGTSVRSSLLTLKREDQKACRAFSALVIPAVSPRSSSLWMALRLARIDCRPIDALVDMTNYVMFDSGQPMHAFDASTLGDTLEVRYAGTDEKIRLLDGDEVSLVSTDSVVTDGSKPLAVAGIMGGRSAMVTEQTNALVLEAGNFNPVQIRLTSNRLKKRTEAAVRFEKSLDPQQVTKAIRRYLKLMDIEGIAYTSTDEIVALASPYTETTIEIRHQFIEQKIGISLSVDRVQTILERIGFGVTVQDDLYLIKVPSFRATKDIAIPEDIVEEVARFVGYSTLIPSYPRRDMKAFDIRLIERMRMLKKFLAFGCSMHEVQTYAFFDEEFLQLISYDPQDALRIANPLSLHWQRLVTSLVPNLLKCVHTNYHERESLRFFECNRVWFMEVGHVEEYECAGIWYEKKNPVDFYEGKELLTSLFHALKIEVVWQKPSGELEPWYDKNQAAELWHNGRIVGRAGKMNTAFLRSVADGEAFAFELDVNFLMHAGLQDMQFKPLEKYPSTELDLSILVSLDHTVHVIEQLMYSADPRITSVQLIDVFEKPEWKLKKSLTFHLVANDPEGTLTKEEIHVLWDKVTEKLKNLGAELR